MDSTTNDDSRKKRDSTDIVERDAKQCEEKTKKLRAATQLLPNVLPSTETDDEINRRQSTNGHALDLEVSLQRIVRLGENDECKEYLSKTKWVKFRVGHASDASALANLYRRSKTNRSEENQAIANKIHTTSQREDTSLEVRLAEGLGDEDSPPTIFALLADVVCDDEDDRKLVAAAVISSGWEASIKVMIVKMFYVSDEVSDSDIAELLERRMWLRLSALALMTSNEMIIEQDVTKKRHTATLTASDV
jgi:hypothetical protein